MNDIEKAFQKIFGDMYLSESETALRIFEYGYKAGAAAENEACAKMAEETSCFSTNGPFSVKEFFQVLGGNAAAAIRERMK